MKALPLILLLNLATGCKVKETTVPVEYAGALREAFDVNMLYSENDRIKTKMIAKRILEFKTGDREFPEGIYLEFYDEKGVLTSTLKANHAYFFSQKNLWQARGKVEVKNIEKKQQLNSEELFWLPSTKKIYTEKFVTIQLEQEVIYGTGLDAAQDMSTYTIKKPEGEFVIKD